MATCRTHNQMVLQTGQEELVPLDAALASALAGGEYERAETLGGVVFPRPFALPPLLEDDIATFADALRRAPEERGWWGWLVTADSRRVVGFVICSKPAPDGTSMIGWSTYAHAQRRGHASRAAQAVMEWAVSTGTVRRIRATIPPALTSSLGIARRLGLTYAGTEVNREAGEVHVFERIPQSS
jgi:RimJ/RimL family protein N-acetyltransferase